MIIPHMWENKSHVPVTTNQIIFNRRCLTPSSITRILTPPFSDSLSRRSLGVSSCKLCLFAMPKTQSEHTHNQTHINKPKRPNSNIGESCCHVFSWICFTVLPQKQKHIFPFRDSPVLADLGEHQPRCRRRPKAHADPRSRRRTPDPIGNPSFLAGGFKPYG